MTSYPSDSGADDTVRALRWVDGQLLILDQRGLPVVSEYQGCSTAAGVAEAIATMQVRGAPAIGIAAAYGVVLAARQRYESDPSAWKQSINADLECLAQSRPTAVNLFWALDRMRQGIEEAPPGFSPVAALLDRALAIHAADVEANRTMGSLGAEVLGEARGVLTHCNTGSLATGGYGTALGVIRSAYRRGLEHIFATETRPWSQGARLTAWELSQDRIPATLIADSAAGLLMRRQRVQWVIVGADRIAANGDTANKIGTYSLAVLARQHGLQFMVVAPTSTIDWRCRSGEDIVIEERDPGEFLPQCFMAPDSTITAWNPVFDVTPADLIDVIVTEKGVVRCPAAGGLTPLS
jgi:methylthioribose-1-phosphate isomerase